jgi:hypothetical protein
LSGLGVAHLTALELAPDVLVREAARAGSSSVGLRLHPAMAGGIAYPLAPGSQALRQLKTTLDSEGVVVNEIEFVELTPLPWLNWIGITSMACSGAMRWRWHPRGRESSAKPARVACRPVRGSCPWPGCSMSCHLRCTGAWKSHAPRHAHLSGWLKLSRSPGPGWPAIRCHERAYSADPWYYLASSLERALLADFCLS